MNDKFRVSFRNGIVCKARNGTVGFAMMVESPTMRWTEEVVRLKIGNVAFADGRVFMGDEDDTELVVPFHNLAGWQFLPDPESKAPTDEQPDLPF